MLEVEDEILQASMCIVQALLAFTEVLPRDPANPERQNPPEEWIEKYGLEAAQQRLLLAERGWDPAAKEPAGSVAARHLVIGIAKARGQKGTVRTPEVNVRISLPAPKSASFSASSSSSSQAEGQGRGDGTPVIYPSRVLDE